MSTVTTESSTVSIAEHIRKLFAILRVSIRAYILVQAICVLIVWLTATFWLGWAIDYLPVLAGASEMPKSARTVWLIITLTGSGYLIWRFFLSRFFTKLPDNTLALLIERKYAHFQESLITSVEHHQTDANASLTDTSSMLQAAQTQAAAGLSAVHISQLFNWQPLFLYVVAAVMAISSVIGMSLYANAGLQLAMQRLYFLHESPWPRLAHIEIVGVEVRRNYSEATLAAPDQFQFENNVVKVPRGANITLLVKAHATAKVLPKFCLLHFTTPDGEHGSVTMKTMGTVTNGEQLYLCDTKPLAGILTSLEFDIVGYDHRLANYRLEVVESPVIVSATYDVEFPQYMVNESQGLRLPRVGESLLPGGQSLPIGSETVLHFTASKELQSATIRVLNPSANEAAHSVIHEETILLEPSGKEVVYALPALLEPRLIEIMLRDTDLAWSEKPYRTLFKTVADESPRWELALQGIGDAITPDAQIPYTARVTDDYAVQRAWLETNFATTKREFPLAHSAEKQLSRLDFRALRHENETFALVPGTKLFVTAKANDFYNVNNQGNLGASESLVLDIVTPEQLLARLEAREIAMRQRLEQIVVELTEMRDTLLIVRPGAVAQSTANELEALEEKLSAEELMTREKELRLLRVQRAMQQVRKSQLETLGVAQAFDRIREELENNRVDTEERKNRLKELIAAPLSAIATHRMPELDLTLQELEKLLDNKAQGALVAEKTLTQTNEILAQIEQILQKMLKLESYNEIIDLVRDLLREQQQVREETKRSQKRELEE
jgi:hypothetical protein